MKLSPFLLLVVFLFLTAPALADSKAVTKKVTKVVTKAHLDVHKKQEQLKQRIRLRQTGFGDLTPITTPGGGGRNGLPNTRLDSFVLNSGGLGEAIYGDDGTSGPPPYFGFGEQHLINGGIYIHGLSTWHIRNWGEFDLLPPSFWSDWKDGCDGPHYGFGSRPRPWQGEGDTEVPSEVEYGDNGWYLPKNSNGSIDLKIVAP